MKSIKSLFVIGLIGMISLLMCSNLSESAYVFMDGYEGIDDNCKYTGAGDWVIKANATDGAFEMHTGTSGSVSFLIEDWVVDDGWWNVTYEFPTNGTWDRLLFWAPSVFFGSGFYANSTGIVGYIDGGGVYRGLDTVTMDTKHLLTYHINTTTDIMGFRFNETSTWHWKPFKTVADYGDVDGYMRAFSFGAQSYDATLKIYDISHNPDKLASEHFQLSPPGDDSVTNYTLVYDVDKIRELKETNPHIDTSSYFMTTIQNAWATNGTFNMMFADNAHLPAEYYTKTYFPLDPRDVWDYCNQSDNDEFTIQIRADFDRPMNVSSMFRWVEQNNTVSTVLSDYIIENDNYTFADQIWTNVTINGSLAEQFTNVGLFTSEQEYFLVLWIGNNKTGASNPWHVDNIGTHTNYNGARWATYDSYGPTAFDNMTFDMQGYIQNDAPAVVGATPVRFESLIDLLILIIPILIVLGVVVILFTLFLEDKKP